MLFLIYTVQLTMSQKKHSDKQQLEFGGAVGTTFLVFGLPVTIMAINIACNKVFMMKWYKFCTANKMEELYRSRITQNVVDGFPCYVSLKCSLFTF